MLTKRIIPCLDIKNGRVVKGVNFVNLRDAGDPVELAAFYDREGADELVFLDITASVEGRLAFLDIVRRTAEQVFIPFTVGGGIRTVEEIREVLRAGADKVSLNSAAVNDPDLITRAARQFGSQCIVVAIDAKAEKDKAGKWGVYTHGGRKYTGKSVISWAQEVEERGAGEILLTSMDRDGTADGFDLELLQKVSESVNIPVIASGGAGELEHFYSAFAIGKADAVLAASIFHFGKFRVKEVKEYLEHKGVPVRW
ncbi:MAG TPA: imidazole glycerol phosphate synthase subunit HisF [Clostridia bacterium]|nr:imidazole glycerol phosphate synthase subunit HisF [Clostridia bacterium]